MDLLVRNLDEKMVARLRATARANRRSMQAEVHAILERADRLNRAETLRASDRWMQYWKRRGKTFSDSTELIREERDAR